MKTSEEISALRKKHRLSQEQLAALIGVSFTTVNSWETSKRKPQLAMSELLKSLYLSDSVEKFKNEKDEISTGMSRTGAGFVSSILSYNGNKDSYPLTHGIGRWYGCLPSQLVSDLVRFCSTDLKIDGEVLVNYSGSGTAALEFSKSGFTTSAVDINPAALFLSFIKTQKISPIKNNRMDSLVDALVSSSDIWVHELNEESVDKNLLTNNDKWICTNARELFNKILSTINRLDDFNEQVITTAALLNISINFCQIDKRCTNHYVFKSNEIIESKFFESLQQEILFISDKLESLSKVESYIKPTLKLQDNQRTNFSDEQFDVVFSHPPYGTTINYFSMSRVQQSILEHINFKDLEFNKEIHKSLKLTQSDDQSSSTLKKFYAAIPKWINESYRVLQKGGYLIVVIGDSRDKGYLSHPHTEVIKEAESLGLRLKELFIWVTENKSGMHIRRKGHHIDHNYILVMEKI
jgi:transcriptional regulator with XRE-family HTH domain